MKLTSAVNVITKDVDGNDLTHFVGELPYEFTSATELALDNADGLRDLDWALCREINVEVDEAIADIKGRPPAYIGLLPGLSDDYFQLLKFFTRLSALCKKHPDATVRVS